MKISVATISFLFFIITVTLGAKTESSSQEAGNMAFNEGPHLSVLHTFSSGGPFHPAECCFSYITHSVPHHRIVDYYETSSECPKPGVVFITKKGHSICANPKNEWVQDYLKDLEEN
ncbi:C-C motif chemokine 14 [Heterocephalus glaber]|uniref:C-C motif chemokine 14 n=1 Tax=Heterocephalus glaber TaxID=10181 RepID=G5B741_HETGA|nr:C-C motif chemokine 14 [Heterocephalus glaber]